MKPSPPSHILLFSSLVLSLSFSLLAGSSYADVRLIKQHCSDCHTGPEPEGDFSLHDLRDAVDSENVELWINSLKRVEAGEMPPADHSQITDSESQQLQTFLRSKITLHEEATQQPYHTPPRRLNNREFENSLRHALLLDDVGTHDPLADLLGDSLHEGFDTHGETLGLSEYHLDQYLIAVRQTLGNVLFSSTQPESQRYRVGPNQLKAVDVSNRTRVDKTFRSDDGVDIRGPLQRIACTNFPEAPHAGNYRITVRAKALDRHVYTQEQTGIHDDDPLTLRMHLGNRNIDFDLVEGEVQEFETNVWLAKGTSVEFSHLTDGLRLIGNGNFKFQYRIGHDYIKANDPKLYARVVAEEVPKAKFRSDNPSHWVHWVPYWQGPRPLIANVTIEGPFFEAWPPQRHAALLGNNPDVQNAAEILMPIAQRAWRRSVSEDELKPFVELVHAHFADHSSADATLADSTRAAHIEALQEGIAALLVSPSFLILNPEDVSPEQRFATKLSYLLNSSPADDALLESIREGELDSFEGIAKELKQRIGDGRADEFLREFPYGWLQLDRINFMAPDVDRYPLYEKKKVSEDMVNEVLAFFRHAVQENRPVPELLTADYSFVNADLAPVYDLKDVPHDSVHRKYVFPDGRRGGFLGMGAFLTLTADTLNTSPIHRAVYVMENFMGIHPSPPPSDVEIKEPDVRSATTIREVLQAHQSDASCAACHQNIDPFGYAFENFDPIGAWRSEYEVVTATTDSATKSEAGNSKKKRGGRKKPAESIAIDASATFLSGAHYDDIGDFREIMQNEASQKRFVRCFITKLLTYANGIEPDNFTQIEAIVERSAQHDYRLIETIAAVIDSPLFRESENPDDELQVKHLFGPKQLLRKLQTIGMTAEQTKSFNQLSRELTTNVNRLRHESGITRELVTRRDEVYSKLKTQSFKGDAIWLELQKQTGITDQQRDAFQDIKRLNRDFRAAVLKTLTQKQKAVLKSAKRPAATP